MKAGNEPIRTWINRMRRIVRRAALNDIDDTPRWSPEVTRRVQMEFDFQPVSSRAPRRPHHAS